MAQKRILKPWTTVKPYILNKLKRPEYYLYYYYCAVPTEVVSVSANESNHKILQLFEDITPQGMAMDATAMGLFVIGALTFAGSQVQVMSSRNRLITNGFFRYSRNPMAISCMLSMIGGCLLTHSPLLIIALPSIGWSVINFYAIPIEEKELMHKYGKGYENYMKCTNKWIGLKIKSIKE